MPEESRIWIDQSEAPQDDIAGATLLLKDCAMKFIMPDFGPEVAVSGFLGAVRYIAIIGGVDGKDFKRALRAMADDYDEIRELTLGAGRPSEGTA